MSVKCKSNCSPYIRCKTRRARWAMFAWRSLCLVKGENEEKGEQKKEKRVEPNVTVHSPRVSECETR